MRRVNAKLMQGPCYLKLLVNHVTAGSLIGKTGSTLEALQGRSGAYIRVFPSDVQFPGTNERIVVLGGSHENLEFAVSLILAKIEEVAMSGNTGGTRNGQKLIVRMALPRSAAAAVIGKGGQQIRQLQEASKALIQISNRDDGPAERVVTISGSSESVRIASIEVMSIVQSDTALKDYLTIDYRSIMPHMGLPPSPPYSQMGGSKIGIPYVRGINGLHTASSVPVEMLPHHCEIYIHIPDESVGAIIGKGGSFLSEMMTQSGARVSISQKGELIPGTTDRECRITGSVNSVHAAHLILLLRLEQAYNSQNGNYVKTNAPYPNSGGEYRRRPSNQDTINPQTYDEGQYKTPGIAGVSNALSNREETTTISVEEDQ